MKSLIVMLLTGLSLAVYAQPEEEQIRNGEFDDGRRYWVVRTENSGDAQLQMKSDALMSGANYAEVAIESGGAAETDVYFYSGCPIEAGHFYTIRFTAMASRETSIRAVFAANIDAEPFWSSESLTLTTEPREFGPFRYYSGHLTSSNRMTFLLGGADDINIAVDAVSVTAQADTNYITTPEKFAYRSHTFQETTLPYRLCPPDFYDAGKSYPLVLALHGAGERGTDNEIHIEVHRMATSWADSANQKNYPCFVVAPQCPENNRWADNDWSLGYFRQADMPESNEMKCVRDMLDSLITEFSIDTNRIYITGLSMGGYGTWDMITRYPDLFAAAIPMSGGGDSTRVDRIDHLPIWAFHGEVDNTVPVEGTRQMITALENNGLDAVYTHCREGDCTGMGLEAVGEAVEAGARLLYTEWEGKAHVMWAESYDYPHLFPWVFAQNKQNNSEPVNVHTRPLPTGFALGKNYPNPFNPTTTIEYRLAGTTNVKLEIVNSLGQNVQTLVNGSQSAGEHQVRFDGAGLASGVYLYRLTTPDFQASRAMVLKK